MQQEIDFLAPFHKRTQRDYVGRVTEANKAECATKAKQWGYDYWDGYRKFGYGGYNYDGRWLALAESMAKHYGLQSGDKILDIGCGKAHLLYEFTRAVPGIEIMGLDISTYGLQHAKEEVKPYLQHGNAIDLPFKDNEFDLVISITTLHNLYNFDLMKALQEINRVSKNNSYLCVESYRNESEKANLLYWQLTCESFFTPDEWRWFFDLAEYRGDYGFIFFE